MKHQKKSQADEIEVVDETEVTVENSNISETEPIVPRAEKKGKENNPNDDLKPDEEGQITLF